MGIIANKWEVENDISKEGLVFFEDRCFCVGIMVKDGLAEISIILIRFVIPTEGAPLHRSFLLQYR
jgi:hypothetical protein